MKKLLLAALAVFLAGCGSDTKDLATSEDGSPKTGQYIARTSNIIIAVEYSACPSVTVFTDGRYTYQLIGAKVSGSWPAYVIDYGPLVLACDFSKADTFTGKILAEGEASGIPSGLTYRYDTTVLDRNGDGIIDNMQNFSK